MRSFQDIDHAGDRRDSKSTANRVPYIFGTEMFVPISRIDNERIIVLHRSVEADVLSLDAGVRMEGLSALTQRDTVIDVLGSATTLVAGDRMRRQQKRKTDA